MSIARAASVVTTRLGMLTPSSNTVLEPVTTAILSNLPEVSVHFSRFHVTEIALHGQALSQFNVDELLRAATLLAHAQVQAILWNGTSAGWLGFESDQVLCNRVTEETGIPCGTSVHALNEIFALTQVRRFALVTPYRTDVQQRIMENYRRAGFEVIAERHMGIQDNFRFATVSPEQITNMVREVARAGPQAIAIFCTNLCGAPLVEQLEAELGIPIYDSVATATWKALALAGTDVSRVLGWGRLFREVGVA